MDVVQEARDLKNSAMDERDLENWQGAITLLDRAEKMLRDALVDLAARPGEKGSDLVEFETSVKKQLYHVLGSIGGVYRRKAASTDREPDDADLVTAIHSYDAGYLIEREFVDSYNLVQRLVTRVLLRPSAALETSTKVADLDVRPALREAKNILDAQTGDSGPRNKDEYAFADAGIVALLLGEPGWIEAMKQFMRRAPRSSYARNVTVDVLKELAARAQDGSAATAPLRERIDEALRDASQ